MKNIVRLTVLMLLFSCTTRLTGQMNPPGAPHEKQTWYDALLRKFNPQDLDYGEWLESRRQAFLDATVRNRYFWYSALVTALEVCTLAAYWKRTREAEHTLWVVAAWIADLYNHDLHSRQVAREAIDRFNRHVEQCNHAIESAGSSNGRPGWRSTQLEELKEESRRKDIEIERISQERNRLQEELTRKTAVMSELSLRVDALRKSSSTGAMATSSHEVEIAPGERMRLVQRINQLEEELYASQQQNKRVKGG
jgi:hypothetical protein